MSWNQLDEPGGGWAQLETSDQLSWCSAFCGISWDTGLTVLKLGQAQVKRDDSVTLMETQALPWWSLGLGEANRPRNRRGWGGMRCRCSVP